MKHHSTCIRLLAFFLMTTMLLAADDASRKLCWAHVVRWGFFQQTYDNAGSMQDMENVATDRTLLGKLTHERAGFWGNPKAQIRSARQYGIDGFCVDMVDPKSYIELGMFLNAAEGTDFKVALAMDNYVHRPPEYCITHIGNYLRKYYNHPNHARVDGKPVIFIYNTGMKLDQWKTVVDALKEQGLEAYYLIRASFEWEPNINKKGVFDALEVADGLYDFGCNGYSPTQMNRRVADLAACLQEKRPNGVLVAGVACGYLGRAVGHYRPFLNSRSTIHGWESIFANPRVNWVCITTWNDYTETTHIEPSVVNRDSLARLNQEYIRQWKGQPLPARPAQPIFSYHEEVMLGHDWTFEIINFPYTCGDYSVTLRIEDNATGKLLKQFPAVKLPKDKINATTLRLTHADMQSANVLKLYVNVKNDDDKQTGTLNSGKTFKRLYPVTRRVEHVESQRTIRLPFDDLCALDMNLTLANGKLEAKAPAWEFGGKIELLRNGYPVWEKTIQHRGAPIFKMNFDLPSAERSPQDVLLLRYTDVSNQVAFSNPVLVEKGDTKTLVQQPVIVTGSDFDEDWPLWPARRPAHLETVSVPACALYKLRFDLTEGNGTIARSATDWKIPLSLGVPGRGFSPLKGGHLVPEWVQEEGPQGETRPCLKFYGDSIATLPVRTSPVGVFTMEALIKPEAFEKPVVLFGEQKPFKVAINPDGTLEFDYLGTPYKNKKIKTTKALKFDQWSHIAVVCAGSEGRVYINGKLAGKGPLTLQTYVVNSLPAVGNVSRSRVDGFRGLLAGYAVAGMVLDPAAFQLPLPAAR